MAHREPGRFVVLEGADGSGTTTVSRWLVDRLQQRGIDARWTCEPSQGPVGALIRQILSRRVVVPAAVDGAPGADTMALLFAADRMDHLQACIEPWLASGAWVVCDRYYHSTLVYQGLGADFDWIRTIHRSARVPDMTVLVDVPVDVAAARRRGDPTRDIEELYETDDTQRRIAERYRGLRSRLAEPMVVLDGSASLDVVQQATLAAVEGWISS